MIRKLLILPIRGYQKWISPFLGDNCRYRPTCSAYMIQAIEIHGAIKGLLLGTWRILRCNPIAPWGYDPVPEKGKWKNPAKKVTPYRWWWQKPEEETACDFYDDYDDGFFDETAEAEGCKEKDDII